MILLTNCSLSVKNTHSLTPSLTHCYIKTFTKRRPYSRAVSLTNYEVSIYHSEYDFSTRYRMRADWSYQWL